MLSLLARFFYQRAQTILEIMAKATSAEKKRRQIYRGEVHGHLPFDTKLDEIETVPAIDFSPSGGRDINYTLERSDVETFLGMLDAFEQELQSGSDLHTDSIQTTRKALGKLVEKMDNIEMSFDKIVERSREFLSDANACIFLISTRITVLSASRLSYSRRRRKPFPCQQ